MSSRTPTPAIALHLPCIQRPNSSKLPSRLDSGGNPSERPPPPTQTLSAVPRQGWTNPIHNTLQSNNIHQWPTTPRVRVRANPPCGWLGAVVLVLHCVALSREEAPPPFGQLCCAQQQPAQRPPAVYYSASACGKHSSSCPAQSGEYGGRWLSIV